MDWTLRRFSRWRLLSIWDSRLDFIFVFFKYIFFKFKFKLSKKKKLQRKIFIFQKIQNFVAYEIV